MTTRILLVRHGESAWNAIGRWQGWADPELSDLGRQQALEAAAAVGAVDAIVASDLQRAMQTALIISEAIGVGPVQVEAGLRERDVGDWTGLTRAEIDERWPGTYEAWRTGGMPSPPGGEANEAIIERVVAAIREVAGAFDGGEVLVVAHGGVIRLLERHHGVEKPPPCPNLGGVFLDVHGERIDVGDRVLLLDPSTDHVTAHPNL
ncbi:MAG TPA: histidine phosphatase family protein [Acidimicrobiales bacterium]|nr:histidine phosphatase family protein [Acidimicrobiales bacterium]